MSETRSMYSSRVGTVSPLNSAPNQPPASSFSISSRVKSEMFQGARSGNTCSTSVVRLSVVSCITISSPSLVRWTSFSTQSMPRSSAASTAARVFSGA